MKAYSITHRLIATILLVELLAALCISGAALVYERHVRFRSFDGRHLLHAHSLSARLRSLCLLQMMTIMTISWLTSFQTRLMRRMWMARLSEFVLLSLRSTKVQLCKAWIL